MCGMTLKLYLSRMLPPEREAFALRVGTTAGHLKNVARGDASCNAKLANQIAIASAGAVTRQMLCPDDYWEIWPDLPPPDGWAARAVAAVVVAPVRRQGVRVSVGADKSAPPMVMAGG